MRALLAVKDKKGKTVFLSQERWRHVTTEHPDLVNELEEIEQTVRKPLFIRENLYDTQVQYLYQWCKKKKKHLMVAVRYLNGKGFIITAFYVRNVRT